eukprot:2919286-Prymnesium_polylepis.1
MLWRGLCELAVRCPVSVRWVRRASLIDGVGTLCYDAFRGVYTVNAQDSRAPVQRSTAPRGRPGHAHAPTRGGHPESTGRSLPSLPGRR